MPCRSDHMYPSSKEKQLSELLVFLEEVQGNKFNKNYYKGYHPDSYAKHPTQEKIDECTSKLCFILGTANDLSSYSEELQCWWECHQKWDKKDGR